MAGAGGSWATDEAALRSFCDTAKDAASRRGITGQTLTSKVSLSFGTALEAKVDVGDEDHMRALMGPIRQLLLQKDPQSFNRISNILARRLPPGDRLDASIHNRQEWKKALEAPMVAIHDGQGHKLTPKEMFDLVAYSGVFHKSPDTVASWEALGAVLQEMALAQIPPLLVRLTAVAMAQRKVILLSFDDGAFDTN